MNMKKLFAAAASAAVAVSVFSISDSALGAKTYIDERTPGKDYFLTVNTADENIPAWCKDSGVDVTEVYGVRYYIEVGDASGGFGGGIVINGESNNWESHDWGNADAGKEIVSDGTYVELLKDAPVFKTEDTYANFCLQNWWGDFQITDVDILGKDGVILSTKDDAPAEAVEEAVVEEIVEEAAAEEEVVEEVIEEIEEPVVEEVVEVVEEPVVVEAAPAVVEATPSTPTGNTSGVAIVSIMAIAAAVAAVSKKIK